MTNRSTSYTREVADILLPVIDELPVTKRRKHFRSSRDKFPMKLVRYVNSRCSSGVIAVGSISASSTTCGVAFEALYRAKSRFTEN